jgi:O-antigen/teichoic acid export membrane protein
VNSSWSAGADVVVAILAFLQSVLVVRLLGVQEYGLWGIATAFVSTVQQLTSCRIGEFVIKYLTDAVVSGRRDRQSASLTLAYSVTFASTILALVLAWWLSSFASTWLAKDGNAAVFFRLFSWVLIGSLAADVSTAVLQVAGRFRALSILQVLKAIVTIVGIALVALGQGGLAGVIYAVLIATATHTVVLHALASAFIVQRLGWDQWRSPRRVFAGEWNQVRTFLLSTNVTASVSVLTKDSDNLWLAYFRSPVEVAYYKLAYSLAHLPLAPVQALVQPTFRELASALAERDWPAARRLLRQTAWISAAWVTPAALATAILGPILVETFYGQEFLAAVPALLVLLIGLGVSNVWFWNRPVLLSLGDAQFLLRLSLVVLALKLGLVFLLVPAFGFIGNAALLTILYVVGVSVSVRRAYRVLDDAEARTQSDPTDLMTAIREDPGAIM